VRSFPLKRGRYPSGGESAAPIEAKTERQATNEEQPNQNRLTETLHENTGCNRLASKDEYKARLI
jgi:hypothetical protein